MIVFKFGGASVKDADSVKNLIPILARYPGDDLLVVISAMGKTTNALESVVSDLLSSQVDEKLAFEQVQRFHKQIVNKLFEDEREKEELEESLWDKLTAYLDRVAQMSEVDEAKVYDQIVSYGELASTKIISAYLNGNGVANTWCDARTLVRTDSNYKQAQVDWKLTGKCITAQLSAVFSGDNEKRRVVITQGFIGGNESGETTTLGREGSDFSAAIFAHVLDAEKVVIWKDVPGLMSADPNQFESAELLEEISYKEAVELSYYGASVIHPKTIKPLQNKNIPLWVKGFLQPDERGSLIHDSMRRDDEIASTIFKHNQVLISFIPRDFSFIAENNLSELFESFARCGVRINLMENTALNFSVCIDNDKIKILQLISDLKGNYQVRYNENLSLLTIRHYTEEVIGKLTKNKTVLVLQKSRNTARFVLRKER